MNAYEVPNLRYSLPAGADVAIRRFVRANAVGAGVLVAADKDVIGVSMNEAKAGEVLEVSDGIVMVEAGGTVAAGDSISSGALGKAVKAVAGPVVGIALTGAASGSLIAVKIV